MDNQEYLVSKNFDRFFMAFLLIGGITLFAVVPLLVLMSEIIDWRAKGNEKI